jgi:hypothetical protein
MRWRVSCSHRRSHRNGTAFGPVSYFSVTRSTRPKLTFPPSVIKLTLTAPCSLFSPFYAQPLSTTDPHMCPGIRPLLLPILLLEIGHWTSRYPPLAAGTSVYSRSCAAGAGPPSKKQNDLLHTSSYDIVLPLHRLVGAREKDKCCPSFEDMP